jgi:hypothetical protein
VPRCHVQAVNVLKAHGKSARESLMLKGYALNLARAAQGMPKRLAPPGGVRIACLDMNLQKARMMMGVQVGGAGGREVEAESGFERRGARSQGRRQIGGDRWARFSCGRVCSWSSLLDPGAARAEC